MTTPVPPPDRTRLPAGAEQATLDLVEHVLTVESWLVRRARATFRPEDFSDEAHALREYVTWKLLNLARALWLTPATSFRPPAGFTAFLRGRDDRLEPEDTWAGVWGWLVMFAAAPEDHHRMMPVLLDDAQSAFEREEGQGLGRAYWRTEASEFFTQWRSAVPSPWSGLAYAAGLTPDEARAALASVQATGDTEVYAEAWRLLGALRGWRFPQSA